MYRCTILRLEGTPPEGGAKPAGSRAEIAGIGAELPDHTENSHTENRRRQGYVRLLTHGTSQPFGRRR